MVLVVKSTLVAGTPMKMRRMCCWWRSTWSGGSSGNNGTPSNYWTMGEDDVEGDGELGRVHCLCVEGAVRV